jgi:hypothetical protein
MSQVTITITKTNNPDGTDAISLAVNPMSVTVENDRALSWVIQSDDPDWVFDAGGVVIAGPNDIRGGSGFSGWPQNSQPQFLSDTRYSVFAPAPGLATKYRYTINLTNKTTKAKIRWDPDIEDRPT